MLQGEPLRMYECKFNEMFMVCIVWWLLMMLSFHFYVMLRLSSPWFCSDSLFYEALNYNNQPKTNLRLHLNVRTILIIHSSCKSRLSVQVVLIIIFLLLGTVEKWLKQCFYRVTEIYRYGAFSKELDHQKVPVSRPQKEVCILLSTKWILDPNELKFALWRGKHSRLRVSDVLGDLNVCYCRLKPTLSEVGKGKPEVSVNTDRFRSRTVSGTHVHLLHYVITW